MISSHPSIQNYLQGIEEKGSVAPPLGVACPGVGNIRAGHDEVRVYKHHHLNKIRKSSMTYLVVDLSSAKPHGGLEVFQTCGWRPQYAEYFATLF